MVEKFNFCGKKVNENNLVLLIREYSLEGKSPHRPMLGRVQKVDARSGLLLKVPYFLRLPSEDSSNGDFGVIRRDVNHEFREEIVGEFYVGPKAIFEGLVNLAGGYEIFAQDPYAKRIKSL